MARQFTDSGVPWLGQIPTEWRLLRLKHAGRLISGSAFPPDLQDNPNEALPFFKVADLVGADENDVVAHSSNTVSRSTAMSLGCRTVPVGAVVYAKIGAALLLNRRRIAGVECCIDNNMTAFVPDRARVVGRWAYYWLSKIDFGEHVNPGAVPSLSEGYQSELPIFVPPLAEQQWLTSFLDRETARIDALIEKKRQLLELLEEKRLAVITHAVTKGLNPSAPMKDSGIDWLGQIPAHWDAAKTRLVAKLESGHTPSRYIPEYWDDCHIPWFTLNDVWQLREGRRYVEYTAELISDLGLANSSARLLPKGTVILSRTASVGFTGILARPMATTQDFVNWICGSRISPEYLFYVFKGMAREFRRVMRGSTHQTIYMPVVQQFSTPVPPIGEQEQITRFLDRETAQIDLISSAQQRAIGLLHEYRSALITNAVTGKSDVREAAHKEADQ